MKKSINKEQTAKKAVNLLKQKLNIKDKIIFLDNTHWLFFYLSNHNIPIETIESTKEIATKNNLDFRINIYGFNNFKGEFMNLFPTEIKNYFAQIFIGFTEKTSKSEKKMEEINKPYLEALKERKK